ncbi:phage-related portal protein [Leifsonia xyli subsp. cynodontis DSM 46306]|jgi:phage portal protein BeeE|uniref:Uncharacterized protein n=2 Tax=Leifsonia xyli TaxID=1575 RepID=U3P850_LEIXC|nr:phage-related portal protein [Leifsonia xyli subsp. cynodontis DSM 46306]
MPQEQIDALIARWVAARTGENGGVGFTNATVNATTMGQAPEQLMIAAHTQSALDVARACNLPAWAVDVSVEGNGMNYTTVPARSRELLDYTLQPYVDAITSRLTLPDVLPQGQECTAVTAALIAGDFNARMQGYQSAIAAGIYTPDECRLIEAGQSVPLRGDTPQENPDTPKEDPTP